MLTGSRPGHNLRGDMQDVLKEQNTNRVPTFSVPGLVLLGPANAQVSCNVEALRILAYPNGSVNAKKVPTLISEKLPTLMRSRTGLENDREITELVSGRRRYLCSRYSLDMHGPQTLRTTAILLERAGSPDVTMYELCNRFHLTSRERQAVSFLVKGMTSKEIAQEMGISPNTVKSFLRLVMTKAGVSTRAGLIGRVAGISLHNSTRNGEELAMRGR
jgi:DNA-binding CsgD family transcriptional regulator